MAKQILISLIKKSMQDSAVQVRRSFGRTSYAATHSQALHQANMLEQAKQAAQKHQIFQHLVKRIRALL